MARALRSDYFPLGLDLGGKPWSIPGTVRLARQLSETEIDSWRLDTLEGFKTLVALDVLERLWRS